LEHYQERGTTVNSVSCSEKLQDQFKRNAEDYCRTLSQCCTTMPVGTLPPTPLNASANWRRWSVLRLVLVWLHIACLVHSKTLWEAAISPVTKKWNKRRMRGLSLNQRQLFLRAYRSLWTAGRSVLKRTETI
jgi:hypothetical protein